MSLWFILYTGAGLIGGVWGPLPYDMTECMDRRDKWQMQADAKPDISQGMRFACEFRDKRPELTAKE